MKNIKNLNNSIVKIDLNCRNDIRIIWNFNGMLMPNIFRRHIFLCHSTKEELISHTFQLLEQCYRIFKNGDIYTMGTLTSTQMEWHEKTKIDKFSLNDFFLKSKYLLLRNKTQWLKKVITSFLVYKQPTFVVIVKDPDEQNQEIQKIIMDLRQKKGLNCLFMIYSLTQKQYKIQFSKGLCFVGKDKKQLYSFYKFYYEHVACFEAEIILESLSGNAFMKDDIWKSTQFSIFRRKIYYPLANNITDIIETYRLGSQSTKTWKFKIILMYKLLNGQIYYDSKQIQIQIIPGIQKNVTYKGVESQQNKYPLSWEVFLQQNPFYRQFELVPGI